MRAFIPALLLVLAPCQTGFKGSPPISRAESNLPLPSMISLGTGAELSAEQLDQLAKMHTSKCARCHKLYDPTSYSQAEWQFWVLKMTKKARLKPDQQEMLIRYRQSLQP